MNVVSGIGISIATLGIWMSIWMSPREEEVALFISLALIVAGGLIFIISLPVK